MNLQFLDFYQFAFESGFIDSQPHFSFRSEDDSEDNISYLEDISTSMKDEYFSEKDLKDKILANISGKSSFIIKRNKLIMKLGYYAGLRSFEVTHPRNFNKQQLKALLPRKWSPKSEKVTIFGKGKKIRTFNFPIQLLDDLHEYLWEFEDRIGNGNIIWQGQR